MAKLFYGTFEKILYEYYECYGGMTAALFSEMLLGAGLDEAGLDLLINTDETVFSKFRSGRLSVYDSILSYYYKADIRDRVAPYFAENFTKYIGKERVADLLREFSDLIFSDGDISFDQKNNFEQLAKLETLNDFLSEVFIYAIKQKRTPQRVIKFPFKYLPFEKNVFFTGRSDEIKEIHDNFHNAVRMQTISGMSGSGKTQIALEYAHRFAGEYDGEDNVVWWIDAESSVTIHTSFKLFLECKNCLPEIESAEVIRETFLDWFDNHDRWLLIYDNAVYATIEEYEVLQKHLPKNSGVGNILLTTVCNTAYAGEPLISIDVFPESEAVEFLQKRTKNYDDKKAADLAERLGYLPLALEQAGAFIAKNKNGGYDAYQKLLQKYGIDTFTQTQKAKNHKHTLTATLQIALDKIQMPSAVELMNICAYLSPDGILTSIFIYATRFRNNEPETILPTNLFDDMTDELRLHHLISELTRYSLCKCEYSTNGNYPFPEFFNGVTKIYIHRLVQEVIRERLGDDLRYLYICIEMICWAQIFDIIPNFLTVLEHIERINPVLEDTFYLLGLASISRYMATLLCWQQQDAAKGFWICKKGIYFTELLYGRNHINTADALYSAFSSYSYFYYEECLKYLSEAMDIYQGIQDVSQAHLYCNYFEAADICILHGDLENAEKYYEKMMAAYSQASDRRDIAEGDADKIDRLTSKLEDLKDKLRKENTAEAPD